MKKIILLSLCAVLFCGCAKTNGTAPGTNITNPSSPATTPLTPSQLAGTGPHYAACSPVSGGIYGATVDGMSILKSITLNTNLTYAVTIFLFTGTACQAGGTEIFAYTQAGNYTLGSSVATTPAGATDIIYTSAGSTLTIYAATGIGSTWASYFNSYCPGGPTFNTTATSSADEGGRTCSHVSAPAFSFPIFPANGTVFYDTITLDSVSAPTILTTSVAINLFLMGQYSSFPTGTGFNYVF